MLRKFRMLVTGLGAAGALLLPVMAMAADEKPKLDTGDTAWMLTSTALVLMMTIPGLALFYGGMVRKKNVLATVMQSFADRKSTRLNSSHSQQSRMPSSA